MKKLKIFCLSLLLLLATCSVAQAAQIEVWFFPNESGYGKNMVSYTMDATSFIQDNRMYVPVRYLAESLGLASGNILYKDSVVTLKGDIEVKLVIGEPAIYINGFKNDIDVAPVIRDSRTYLPARYVAEAYGFKVEWDGVKSIITGEELVGINDPSTANKTIILPGSLYMPDGYWYSYSQVLISAGVKKERITEGGGVLTVTGKTNMTARASDKFFTIRYHDGKGGEVPLTSALKEIDGSLYFEKKDAQIICSIAAFSLAGDE